MENGKVDSPQFEIVKASEVTEAMTRAEIDVQIATAHKYPRDITKFHRTAISLVSQDEATAAACFYSLPRGGKTIPGESVRLAEIAASAYGNIRVYGRITAIEEKWVVAQGLAHDLESNVCYASEVRRRITDRNGARFNDDMIIVTANAAIAIATRNATFKAVPRALLKPVIEAAERVIRGDVKTLPERRQKAVAWFSERGIKPEALFKYIGVAGIESIDLDRLVQLAGLRTRVEEEGQEAIAEILAGGKAEASVFETAKAKPQPAAVKPEPAPIAPPAVKAPPAASAPETPPSEAEVPLTRTEVDKLLTAAWGRCGADVLRKACLDGHGEALLPTDPTVAPTIEDVLALQDDAAYAILNAICELTGFTPDTLVVPAEPEADNLEALWKAADKDTRVTVKSICGAENATWEAFDALMGEDRADAIKAFTRLAKKAEPKKEGKKK